MSLLEKKLKMLQAGTALTLTLKDGSKYTGVVSENDFEESLAVTGDFGELIFDYSSLSSVVVLHDEQPEKKPAPVLKAEPVKETIPAVSAVKSKNMSFYANLAYTQLPDSATEAFFKNVLSVKERKLATGKFDSYKHKRRNGDKSACSAVIRNMIDEFDSNADDVTANAYRFAFVLLLNAGGTLPEDYLENMQAYDGLALYHFYHGNKKLSAAYAAVALANGQDDLYKDSLYTILAYSVLDCGSSDALIYMLNKKTDFMLDSYFSEILHGVYKNNKKQFPAQLNKSIIVEDLKGFSDDRTISLMISGVDVPSESVQPDSGKDSPAAPVKEYTDRPQQKKGEIFYLSWGEEKGKILSDNGEYEFLYDDVSDKALLKKIKAVCKRDLRAINSVFRVVFTLRGKTVSDISEDQSAYVAKPSFPDTVSVTPALSSLQRARKLLATGRNASRFEEGLVLLRQAMTEEKDPLIPFCEYINCSMSLANITKDETYLEKAYSLYLQYKEQVSKIKGIAVNVPVLDLTIRMKKTEEAIVVADHILEDATLSVETRMNYLLIRAKLLLERVQANEEDGSLSAEEIVAEYERIKNSLLDWEQRFYSNATLHHTGYQKVYYNTVLMYLTKCLNKTGETEKAKDALRKIIKFDPSNENAVAMLTSMRAEESQDDPQTQESEYTGVFTSVDDEDYLDDDDEEQIRYEEYTDIAGWDVLDLTEKDVIVYVIRLIAEDRLPVAVAYLKAASDLNEALRPFYNMLSYATNHPIENPDYRLENVVLQFPSVEDEELQEFAKFAQAAAVLRGSFYHSAENDYYSVAACLHHSVTSIAPSLIKAFEIIDEFRMSSGKGMDLYSDYRCHTGESNEKAIEALVNDAKELYSRYFERIFVEHVSQLRFKLTKSIVFEKNGFIEKMLKCVANNDFVRFKEIKQEFVDLFIRANSSVSVENIDGAKIEAYIDAAWERAGRDKSIHERKTSTLMGSLRNNLKIPIRRIVEVVCSWLVLNDTADFDFSEINRRLYRNVRDELLYTLQQAKDELKQAATDADNQDKAGITVLRETVGEIIRRLDGTWAEDRRRYYFVDFLRSSHVLLNDDFLPDLTFTFCTLPTFNILARIRAHAEDADADMVSFARVIFSREEEKHDFGTAEKIADYLRYFGREDEWKMPENTDACDEQAKRQLRDCYDRFNVELAAAFSRGQIQISDVFLQSVDTVAQTLYQYCLETHNYGFFFRFIDLCQNMIRDNAQEYGVILETQLEHLANEFAMDEAILSKISGYIKTQQFTVAEEMMSRFSKGDLDADDEMPQEVNEYLLQFWNEFDENYNAIARDNGKSLHRIISNQGAMKDRRGGEALVNNWPRGDKCTGEQIATLLGLLGWNDITVEKCGISGYSVSFAVRQDRKIFSRREYAHPIAAFGSQAYNDGFYVVCLFGTTDSVRLIDICRSLDSVAGNKILLVDFAMPEGERRRLAKMMKQISLANTYLVVDRVTLLCMANHYVGGVRDANNRTLFAVSLPFTYYQPYGVGSASITAPELFSGRKEELLSIESPTGANLIYGGRQLGKTAILNKAVYETHDPENGRYAFAIDIKEKNCKESALKVSRWLCAEGIFSAEQITDDWDLLALHICTSIKTKSISYMLLMLDEADCFIDDCQSAEYGPFVALKDVQQQMNGRFKFVLAGLHDIVKFKRDVALGNNSVVAHLSSMNIKPFDFNTARQLLREPLSYLGFDFSDNDTAYMQICSATNYYPGLLQLFCHKLVESLKTNYGGYSENDSPAYMVGAGHIGKVLADKEFQAAIKEKFEITLRLGEGNYYYVIALLLAMLYDESESAEGYSAQEILRIAENVGADVLHKLPADKIDAFLQELCDLNILKMIDSNYAFRTSSFRNLLGTRKELDDQLLKLIAE